MTRLLIGAASSALALMVWGFVFWAGGGADAGFSHVSPETEASVRTLLDTGFPESGTYIVPDPGIGTQEDWMRRHRAGPMAFIFVTKAGADPMSPRVYIMGFLHMFLTALLVGLVLARGLPSGTSYRGQVGFVLLLGVLVGFWSNLSDPIWFYEPWGYHIVTTAYDLVSFAIMGAIMARFVTLSPGDTGAA